MFNLNYLLKVSIYPFVLSFLNLSLFMHFIYFFKLGKLNFMLNLLILTLLFLMWGMDTLKEVELEGKHNMATMSNIKLSMLLFIFSEVMFFMGFFWMFYTNSLNPNIELGLLFPAFKLKPINPFMMPLLNTMILLTSGILVTYSFIYMTKNSKLSKFYLLLTMVLGMYFTMLQMIEYYTLSFSSMTSVFGASFFMMTGFHGLHVLMGTFLLMVSMWFMVNNMNISIHQMSLMLSIWYWHFVDIVWIFLFMVVYLWSL